MPCNLYNEITPLTIKYTAKNKAEIIFSKFSGWALLARKFIIGSQHRSWNITSELFKGWGLFRQKKTGKWDIEDTVISSRHDVKKSFPENRDNRAFNKQRFSKYFFPEIREIPEPQLCLFNRNIFQSIKTSDLRLMDRSAFSPPFKFHHHSHHCSILVTYHIHWYILHRSNPH